MDINWASLTPSPCSVTSVDPDPFSWWKAEFPQQYIVKEITILPLNKHGDQSAANLYVGKHLCAKVPKSYTTGKWLSYTCGGEDGLIGSSVKV